jgi:hypothetical protein
VPKSFLTRLHFCLNIFGDCVTTTLKKEQIRGNMKIGLKTKAKGNYKLFLVWGGWVVKGFGEYYPLSSKSLHAIKSKF